MKLFVLLLFNIVIVSCGAKHESSNSNSISPDKIKDGLRGERKVTFNDFIKPLFMTSCKTCHNADSAIINVLDYSVAVANADLILDEVVITRNMPLGGSMSADERAIVEKWINDGLLESDEIVDGEPPEEELPDESDGETEPELPDNEEDEESNPDDNDSENEDEEGDNSGDSTDNDDSNESSDDLLISFENDIQPLFEQKCSSCHNENSRLINVLDFQTSVNNIQKIFKAVVTDERMPIGGNMSDDERDLVSQWLDNGLKP